MATLRGMSPCARWHVQSWGVCAKRIPWRVMAVRSSPSFFLVARKRRSARSRKKFANRWKRLLSGLARGCRQRTSPLASAEPGRIRLKQMPPTCSRLRIAPSTRQKRWAETEPTLGTSVSGAVQAGGIIVWRDRVVLRRTALGEWVFPKGWIDPGETAEQAAVREVREETGVRAEIVQFAGNASYQDEGETRDVAYYLMRVTDSPEWADHAGADAASFPVDEIERVL